MTELTDEAVKALLEDAGRGYPRLYAEPNPCDLLHEALRALLAARAELVSVLQREAETHRRHDDKFAKMEADLAQARADVKTAVAVALEQAANEIDCGCQDGVCRFPHACPKSDVDTIRALADADGLAAVEALRKERDEAVRCALMRRERLDVAEAELAVAKQREAKLSRIAELEAQVARLVRLVEVAGRARLIIDTSFLEMGETVNYAPSVIAEVCEMLEPHSTLAEVQARDKRAIPNVSQGWPLEEDGGSIIVGKTRDEGAKG